MATHVGDGVAYWLSIPTVYKGALYSLRKWTELKIASEGDTIWVRGFTLEQIESKLVLKIPMIERFYLKDAHLYHYGKKLPSRIEPSLLWSPIHRGLKVTLPKENFNFFGVDQVVDIELVPSAEKRPIDATIVSLLDLESYLYNAPKVRTAEFQWSILDNDSAIIVGKPLLPIRGQDLYRFGSFLIPAGWKLNFECMAQTYSIALENTSDYWYLFNENGAMTKLNKSAFGPLSKGSLAQTLLQR